MDRVNNYNKAKFDNLFHFNEFSYPMELKEIKRFENMNNGKINVYGLKGKGDEREHYKIIPIYISNKETYTKNIKLLFSEDRGKTHYVYIKNFDGLMSGELNYNLRNNQELKICERCTSYIVNEESFKNHERMCKNEKNPTKIIMPKQNKNKFKIII